MRGYSNVTVCNVLLLLLLLPSDSVVEAQHDVALRASVPGATNNSHDESSIEFPSPLRLMKVWAQALLAS